MNDFYYNPSNPLYWSIYGSDSSQYNSDSQVNTQVQQNIELNPDILPKVTDILPIVPILFFLLITCICLKLWSRLIGH